MSDPSLKLQAFLAHAGIASRRASEKLIEEGKVKVNGEVAHLGQRVIPGKDVVVYHGQTLSEPEQHIYVIINKPVNVVSTTSDELGRKTVLSLLPPKLQQHRLYPVGRLDFDSQGLLLLTNDGDLAHRLTHPSYEVPKTYEVVLDRAPTTKAIEHLERGVKLSDGYAKPLSLTKVLDDTFEITISEGRNHQVKRMFMRAGYIVIQLTRISMGPLHLDQLEDKTYKVLSEEEVLELKQALK